jgi:hypothetical protein
MTTGCPIRGPLDGPGSLTEPPCGKPRVAKYRMCAEHEAEQKALQARDRERAQQDEIRRREASAKAIAQANKAKARREQRRNTIS